MSRKTPAISRHSHFHALLEALRQPGCALCALAARTCWRYLDSIAYESVNDLGLRARLRHSLGFCNRHAWFFVENVREVFGAAIIYRDVLHSVLHRAGRATHADGPSAFEPTGPCIACAIERESTDLAIDTLTEAIAETDVRAALAASEGFCAPHLLRALAVARSAARRPLAASTLAAWEAGQDDPRLLRWHAAGLAGAFGPDDAALAGPPAEAVPTSDGASPATSTDPFTCPICAVVQVDLGQFVARSELDDGTSGICNVHAWLGGGPESAALFRRQLDVARAQAAALVEAPEASLLAQAVRGLRRTRPKLSAIAPPLRCVVCARQAALEVALAASDAAPLCLPHLRRAIAVRGVAAIAPVRPTWRQLDQLLGEFIRKEDYRFRREPRGLEQHSPRWTIALVAGAPGIR